MLRNFLLVGFGGAIGCMARYGCALLVTHFYKNSFPLATLLINVAGCFIIGLLFGLGAKQPWLQGWAWLVLASGFCGGFTTFSTFALENMQLLGGRQNFSMLVYTALSVVLGLILCRAGMWMVK